MPFPVWLSERRVVLEQTSGEGCSDERPMTLTESGRFRFVSAFEPGLETLYHYRFPHAFDPGFGFGFIIAHSRSVSSRPRAVNSPAP